MKDQINVKKNVLIPMRDGVELSADLYMPETNDPLPTILKYYPYRKDDYLRALAEPRARYFAERGYISAILDIRGTGSSGGYTDMMMRKQEWEDGYDAVEWIADQEWCDGNVGMTGVSYGGFSSMLTARENPPHLKAIIPIYFGYDLYQNTHEGNVGFICAGPYNSMMTALNAVPPARDPAGRWLEVWDEHLENNSPWGIPWMDNESDNEMWREGSIKHDIEKVECATYIIGSWHDVFVSDPLKTYMNLNPKTPKKLLMGPYLHIAPIIGVPGPKIDHLHESLRWFDRWLKNIDTGIENEPPVTIFVRKFDPPTIRRDVTTGFWRNELEWPLKRSIDKSLYLHPKGLLGSSPIDFDQTDDNDFYTYDPTVGYTTMGLLTGFGADLGLPIDQRPDESKSLVYTSDSLENDLEVTGFPRAILYVSSTTDITRFVVKLCDVTTDGISSLVSKASINMAYRDGNSNPSLIKPGEIYKIELELEPMSYIFEKGHRIRISIASSDFPRVIPTPKNCVNNIYRSETKQSQIILPIIQSQNNEIEKPNFLDPPDTSFIYYPGPVEPTEWRVKEDVVNGYHIIEIKKGGTNIIEDKIVKAYDQIEAKISVKNPADTKITSTSDLSLTDDFMKVDVQSTGIFQSSLESISYHTNLEVKTNGKNKFQKNWIKTVPRKFI